MWQHMSMRLSAHMSTHMPTRDCLVMFHATGGGRMLKLDRLWRGLKRGGRCVAGIHTDIIAHHPNSTVGRALCRRTWRHGHMHRHVDRHECRHAYRHALCKCYIPLESSRRGGHFEYWHVYTHAREMSAMADIYSLWMDTARRARCLHSGTTGPRLHTSSRTLSAARFFLPGHANGECRGLGPPRPPSPLPSIRQHQRKVMR